MDITVLFENEDILAVEKPLGLAAIPERLAEKDSLVRMLEEKYSKKLFVVHRLDKEVSGVIVFAKNADSHRYLNDLFSSRLVKKQYRALVHGLVEPPDGVINKAIRQFGSGRMGIDYEKGKPSETEFEVLERVGNYTLIKAFPHTGRRHQIRVHFYCIGHPIVGDLRYGDKTKQQKYPRLMLHAHQIEFVYRTGDTIFIESPIPDSFLSVLDDIQQNKY